MSLVSVILPNYNYDCFLRQRIDSILSQTYDNIELIILDDCSSDNSFKVIESYRKHNKVKAIVYNEHNSGSTFKQWQKGFQFAEGEFIWIAEADDYADIHFLEEIVERMKENKDIKVGFSNSYWVTPNNTFINKDYTIKEHIKIYDGKSFIKKHLLKENYIYNASMAVFRKDVLTFVDTDFEDYRSCGDKLFWSSIASLGKVLFVCKPLNYFRIHSEKVTTNSIINGTLFKEEHRLFLKNIEKGYITIWNRIGIVRYFIKHVERTRNDFLGSSIYNECLALWQQEMDYRDAHLPLLYRILCLMQKIFT